MAHSPDRGFTLLETVVALSLLTVALSALAPLVVMAARADAAAHASLVAQQAAREKLEQLRGLAWSSDAGVVPVSDWSTDLSRSPQAAAGGTGLLSATADPLLSNVAGFCDFLDAGGRWLAGGSTPPAGAAWVRRWSVAALDGLADTLVLQVLVVPAQRADRASTIPAARAINGAWLIDVRTRTTR